MRFLPTWYILSRIIDDKLDYRKSLQTVYPLGGNRALVPPDPIPNSEVKWRIADGSAGLPCVRVGHRQAIFMRLSAIFTDRLQLIYLSPE